MQRFYGPCWCKWEASGAAGWGNRSNLAGFFGQIRHGDDFARELWPSGQSKWLHRQSASGNGHKKSLADQIGKGGKFIITDGQSLTTFWKKWHDSCYTPDYSEKFIFYSSCVKKSCSNRGQVGSSVEQMLTHNKESIYP